MSEFLLPYLEEDQLHADCEVCRLLIHAIHQAIYEFALDEEGDPQVRKRAIDTMKGIRADWIRAQKSIRAELANRGQVLRPINSR